MYIMYINNNYYGGRYLCVTTIEKNLEYYS